MGKFLSLVASSGKDNGEPNLDYPATFFNPLYLAEHDINYHDLTTARGYMSVDWDITDNLTFNSKVNGEYSVRNYFGYGNRNHGDYNGKFPDIQYFSDNYPLIRS